MTFTVTGRHIELSPSVRQQIEARCARLERLLNDSALSTQVIVTRERQGIVCEVTLRARGDHTLVGIGRHQRLSSAVGAAIEKVKQQAQKLSDRWKRRRKGSQKLAAVAAAGRPTTRRAAAGVTVVPARRYRVQSLAVDVAAERMGPAAFLVFRRADTGRVAVVFRRPDGKVGLIDPED